MSKVDMLLENLESEVPYLRMQALVELAKIDLNQFDEDESFRVLLISRRLKKDPERAVRQYAMALLERHGYGQWGAKRAPTQAGHYSGLLAFCLNYFIPGLGMLYLGRGWRTALAHFLGAGVIIIVVDRLIAILGLELLQMGVHLLFISAAARMAESDPELGMILMIVTNVIAGAIIYSPVLVGYGWMAKKTADELNGKTS